MKLPKYFYIVFTAALIAIGLIISIYLGDTQRTVPKIKVSYYDKMSEVSSSIVQRLQQEISNQKSFWSGIEPGKLNHLELAIEIKNELEKVNGPFELILVDQELRLEPEQLANLGPHQMISLKEQWSDVSNFLQKSNQQKYYLITASIYSTSFLKQNPIAKMKQQGLLAPMTFSIGYLSVSPDDEGNQVFQCSTDDKEGISGWACATVNKSRSQRRKIKPSKRVITGLMDLTGEKDYMVLVR